MAAICNNNQKKINEISEENENKEKKNIII